MSLTQPKTPVSFLDDRYLADVVAEDHAGGLELVRLDVVGQSLEVKDELSPFVRGPVQNLRNRRGLCQLSLTLLKLSESYLAVLASLSTQICLIALNVESRFSCREEVDRLGCRHRLDCPTQRFWA